MKKLFEFKISMYAIESGDKTEIIYIHLVS